MIATTMLVVANQRPNRPALRACTPRPAMARATPNIAAKQAQGSDDEHEARDDEQDLVSRVRVRLEPHRVRGSVARCLIDVESNHEQHHEGYAGHRLPPRPPSPNRSASRTAVRSSHESHR